MKAKSLASQCELEEFPEKKNLANGDARAEERWGSGVDNGGIRSLSYPPNSGVNIGFLRSVIISLVVILYNVQKGNAVTNIINGSIIVEELVGNPLVLPCDVTPPVGDTVAVILWYREHQPKAIYTYDARNTSLGFQQHTPRDPNLASRAKFHPLPPASLTLSPAITSDTGTYQCRADFANSPSRTTVVKAVVVAPVEELVIERLHHRSQASEAPLEHLPGGVVTVRLHHTLVMKCCAKGGFPAPRVWWLLNNKTIDTIFATNKDAQKKHMDLPNPINFNHRITCNELTLINVTRELDQSKLVCDSSNSNGSAPKQKSVVVLVDSPPSSVKIVDIPEAFEAERLYRIVCDVKGARPRPLIAWTITRLKKKPKVIARQDLRKLSSGKLDIKVSKEDEGAVLICSAVSPNFTEHPVADEKKITVHYAPVVRLELGALLEAGSVREGTDLYFRCIVSAAPLPYRLDWWHGDNQITNEGLVSPKNFKPTRTLHNHQKRNHQITEIEMNHISLFSYQNDARSSVKMLASKSAISSTGSSVQDSMKGTRVVVSNDHLVLQGITKEWTGNFSCSANNVVGDAISNSIQIVVQYPPICVWQSPRVLRAALGELLRLPCSVSALPNSVNFSWTFSNSLSQERITSMSKNKSTTSNHTSSILTSILEYRPITQQDYGTVLCWAQNSVGKQKEPCVYSIRPAPEVLSPPPDCVITSFSHDTLNVKCQRKVSGNTTNTNSVNGNMTPTQVRANKGNMKLKTTDAVTYTQATRMKSVTHPKGKEVVNIHEYDRNWKNGGDASQTEEDREIESKIYPHIPYFTLENKKKSPEEDIKDASGTSRNFKQKSSGESVNDLVHSEDEEKGIVLPYYVMTVRERDTNQLIVNKTSFNGEFSLTGLTPGLGYRMAVTSVGERGIRSPPAPLIATTPLNSSPPNNRPSTYKRSSADLETIIWGAVAGIASVTIIIIFTIVVRRRYIHQESSDSQPVSSSSDSISKDDSENQISQQSVDNEENTGSLVTNMTPTSVFDDSQFGDSHKMRVGQSLHGQSIDMNEISPNLLSQRCLDATSQDTVSSSIRNDQYKCQPQKHGVRFADEISSYERENQSGFEQFSQSPNIIFTPRQRPNGEESNITDLRDSKVCIEIGKANTIKTPSNINLVSTPEVYFSNITKSNTDYNRGAKCNCQSQENLSISAQYSFMKNVSELNSQNPFQIPMEGALNSKLNYEFGSSSTLPRNLNTSRHVELKKLPTSNRDPGGFSNPLTSAGLSNCIGKSTSISELNVSVDSKYQTRSLLSPQTVTRLHHKPATTSVNAVGPTYVNTLINA